LSDLEEFSLDENAGAGGKGWLRVEISQEHYATSVMKGPKKRFCHDQGRLRSTELSTWGQIKEPVQWKMKFWLITLG
jgi:hypothetical protein